MKIEIVGLYLAIHAVVFIAVMMLLRKFLFEPFLEVLRERDDRIGGAEREAKALLGRADETLATYEERFDAARKEANELRLGIRAEAGRQQAEILAEASAHAARTLQGVREQINEQLVEARATLRADAERMGRELAEKILGRAIG